MRLSESFWCSQHWLRLDGVGQSGVAVVAFSGRQTAKTILKNLKKNI